MAPYTAIQPRLLAINLPNSHIFKIDLPENEDPTAREPEKDDLHLIRGRRLGVEVRSDPSIRNVTQLHGDTPTLGFPRADFFYIDGSQTYECVKSDTQRAMSVSDAKTIVGHDCEASHPGVTKWLSEMVDRYHPVRRIAGTILAVLFRVARVFRWAFWAVVPNKGAVPRYGKESQSERVESVHRADPIGWTRLIEVSW